MELSNSRGAQTATPEPDSTGKTWMSVAAVSAVGTWMVCARAGTHWLLAHRYFTTESPLVAIPGAYPAGAGPTVLTTGAGAALIGAVISGVAVFWSCIKPAVPADPDQRRPAPSVKTPLIAVCGAVFGGVVALLIPFVPAIVAGPVALIAAWLAAEHVLPTVRMRRETATYLFEIEWSLLPYLGHKTLPARPLIRAVEWITPENTTHDRNSRGPDCPPDTSVARRLKSFTVTYRGRKPELPHDLPQHIDTALGGHYALSWNTATQTITATATTTVIDPPAIADLREKVLSPELFGDTARLSAFDFTAAGDLNTFTVTHKIALKLAGTSRAMVIERKLNEVLAGRWRARWDNVAGIACFEIRPELPTQVFAPIASAVTSIPEACALYPTSQIPIAVDEDDNIMYWLPAITPHQLIVGPTGTGKTASIHTVVTGASLVGYRIFIIDFKGGEFTSYRTYPNVVTVVTEPYEAVALVNILYREMVARYNLWKRDRKALDSKEPFLIIFDEYTEFQQILQEFYARIKNAHPKIKGLPSTCPTLKMFGSLLRLGRTCRLHCLAATQRPDRQFLEGEAKQNFTSRFAWGRLDATSAQMIFDNAYAGRTVPLGIRGRGTTLNQIHQKHTEVQGFYTPDPGDPKNDQERAFLAKLRPGNSLYERGVIQPPESDPEIDPQPFAFYQDLKLLKASEYPQFDITSVFYDPPAWQCAEDDGTDSIFGALTSLPPTPHTVDELLGAWDNAMSPPRDISVADLCYGDYFQDPDTGCWGFVDDEIVPDPECDDQTGEQAVLVLPNSSPHTNKGATMTSPVDEIVDILNTLRGLLGQGTPVSAPLPSAIPDQIEARLHALPNGTGMMIENLVHQRKSQADIAAELAAIDPSLVGVVDKSAADALAGRDHIDTATDTYRTRKNQLEPLESTTAGQVALLGAKTDALSDASSAVHGTVNAGELRRAAVERLAARYYQQARAAGLGATPTAQPAAAMGGMAARGGVSPLSAAGGGGSMLGLAPPVTASLAAGRGGFDPAAATGENGVASGLALPKGKANERGLQVKTILAARAISAAFPQIHDIGGVRADSLKWHPQGLAIDVMIPHPNSSSGKALGDRVLQFVLAHQRQFGLDHAIWQQTLYLPGSAPRRMKNRGSATANHYDHVHVATSGGGYAHGGEVYAL